MYAFIRGALRFASLTSAVVEAQGIGFQLHIPISAYAKLPALGSETLLHTSFIVREQHQALYGFLAPSDRDLFEILLNVTGIGPKTALALIGHLDPFTLGKAVSGHDVHTISKVPGIGKKTAERLILEIKDKLPAISGCGSVNAHGFSPADPRAQQISDAMSALINLGYNQAVAQKAIQRSLQELSESANLAALITGALKHI